MKEKKISYTAVVLDEKSREMILSIVQPPESWELKAEHMTINLGEARSDVRERVGEEVILTIVSAAIDYGLGVMAIGVEVDVPSKNDVKHITVAINRSIGATPKDSNQLTKWYPMIREDLIGTITEVPFP